MSAGRYLWMLRRRVLGPERVITKEHVVALGRSTALRLRSRSKVRALLLRELALGPPRRARIVVGDARVELGGGADFPVDWKAFVEVFAEQPYAGPYRQARVLDVGAHKGYFSAYALAHGASVVLSVEPEARNYEALARAAGPLGDRWLTRNAAVGSTSGTGTLLLDRTSWAHSLLQVERPAGEQQVEMVTLEQALSDLPAGGSRTIVKIDAEGSECDILSRPSALTPIDLLVVEWHTGAPCTRDQLIRAVESSGLLAMPASDGLMRFARGGVPRQA